MSPAPGPLPISQTRGPEAAGFEETLEVVAGVNTRRMMEDGDVDAGVVACGLAVGCMYEMKPVSEVIRGMVQEAMETAERFCAEKTVV